MHKNRSPWIHQLNPNRPVIHLNADLTADVAIIGAGIAGIATAFFTLKHTEKKVVILERNRLAHGATGHNAGQIVSYFERPFAELVHEFGLERAIAGQKAIEDAWELLDTMYNEAGLSLPLSRFEGYAGFTVEGQVIQALKTNQLRVSGGLSIQTILIAEELPLALNISPEYDGLYRLVPHKEIQNALETDEKKYIACILSQKGVMNSALFCEQMIDFLLKKYSGRFSLYENTSVRKIVLHDDLTLLDAKEHTVTATDVVLCTNGFEHFLIFDRHGLKINTDFHYRVYGRIGYMSGYLENMNKPPTAVSYYTDPTIGAETGYYYLTRRPYEFEKGTQHNLVCIGGPDRVLEEQDIYNHDIAYPEEAKEDIDAFLTETYDLGKNKKVEYVFTWHGLMGYTKNYVRMIGKDPRNTHLLYNLGCNGVGILPSIHGGFRIGEILSGKTVDGSMFDILQGEVQ